MILQRVVVVVVAALAVAWLAVSYGNARVIRHAQVAAADPHASPAAIEAALEIRAGRLDDARRVYEEIVRREPDTPEAWLVLSKLTAKSDPARSAQALAQVRRLDPLGIGATPQP